jgi:hypothetical protein
MNLETFYSVVAGTCFALLGLWWTVMESRRDWLKDEQVRKLAGGVYLSFLIPGAMSLGAQIGGENKLVWRSVFVIAALLGMYFTTRLIAGTQSAGQPGFFRRNRWLAIFIYLIVLVLGAFPTLAAPLGLTALQVEAFLLSLLVLLGHGLAWEFMVETGGQTT